MNNLLIPVFGFFLLTLSLAEGDKLLLKDMRDAVNHVSGLFQLYQKAMISDIFCEQLEKINTDIHNKREPGLYIDGLKAISQELTDIVKLYPEGCLSSVQKMHSLIPPLVHDYSSCKYVFRGFRNVVDAAHYLNQKLFDLGVILDILAVYFELLAKEGLREETILGNFKEQINGIKDKYNEYQAFMKQYTGNNIIIAQSHDRTFSRYIFWGCVGIVVLVAATIVIYFLASRSNRYIYDD